MPDGNSTSVQFQSPTTGAIQPIPPEHWDEALKQGYKPTSHVIMWSPDGQRGMVPKEQLQEKTQAGYQTTPKTQFEKERENQPGFLSALAERAKQFVDPSNLKSMAVSAGRRALFGGFDPIGDIEKVQSLVNADTSRQKTGRSLPYRAIAAIGQGTGVADPTAMERSADIGDWGGVLGNATADVAPVAIGEGLAHGMPLAKSAARQALIDPVTGKAAITPGSLVERWLRTPEEATRIQDARQLADVRRDQALYGERDATRQNVPFAGEEQIPAIWRDATKLNEPFAGEAEPETGTKSSLLSSLSDSGPRFTGNEGRPATWTNEDVVRLAKQGNREAISQLGRRGLQLPENARYVAGDLDYPRVVYNPREVTRFGPEGTPIRQGGRTIQQVPSREIATFKGLPPYKASEKATTMSAAPRDLGPEFTAQQREEMIGRYKAIQRNPNATPEDLAEANRRLEELGAMQ